MFTWEQINRAYTSLALKRDLTPEECASVERLSERYQDTHNCGEFGLDVQRLRFARWLVEHGRLSEGTEQPVRSR